MLHTAPCVYNISNYQSKYSTAFNRKADLATEFREPLEVFFLLHFSWCGLTLNTNYPLCVFLPVHLASCPLV